MAFVFDYIIVVVRSPIPLLNANCRAALLETSKPREHSSAGRQSTSRLQLLKIFIEEEETQ